MAKMQEVPPQIHMADFHPKKDGFVQSYKSIWQEAGVVVVIWLDIVDRDHWQRGHYRPSAYELVSSIGTMSGRPPGAIQEKTARRCLRAFRPQVLAAMTDAGWEEVDTTCEGQPIYQYRPGLSCGRTLDANNPNGSKGQRECELPDIVLVGSGAEVSNEGNQVCEREQIELGADDLLELDQNCQAELPRCHMVEVVGNREAHERGQQPAYSREVWTREITFTCIGCRKTVTQQRYPGRIPLYCGDGCKNEVQREKTRERVARHRKKKGELSNEKLQDLVTLQPPE